jgi:hypothetical protein
LPFVARQMRSWASRFDAADLIAALDSGQLSHAALDALKPSRCRRHWVFLPEIVKFEVLKVITLNQRSATVVHPRIPNVAKPGPCAGTGLTSTLS